MDWALFFVVFCLQLYKKSSLLFVVNHLKVHFSPCFLSQSLQTASIFEGVFARLKLIQFSELFFGFTPNPAGLLV